MKRDPEELDALVVEALRRSGPITASALAVALREQGHSMPETQAYRVLKRLIARGHARYIWLGRRYVLRKRADPPSLMLSCSGCGNDHAVPCKAADSTLRAAASALGFAVDEVILEVSGRCSSCGPSIATGTKETVP